MRRIMFDREREKKKKGKNKHRRRRHTTAAPCSRIHRASAIFSSAYNRGVYTRHKMFGLRSDTCCSLDTYIARFRFKCTLVNSVYLHVHYYHTIFVLL